MKLHIIEQGTGTLASWLDINDERAQEIFDHTKLCVRRYNTPGDTYSFPKMLYNIARATTTPEELFLASHIMGRLMERDCSNCEAKKVLAGILQGIVDIQKVDIDDPTLNVDLSEMIRNRFNKDMN